MNRGRGASAPDCSCPSGFPLSVLSSPPSASVLLTWNHSAVGGLEAGSSVAYRPPPKQQMRPGRWWPARRWRRSPQSPCFRGLPATVLSHPLSRWKLLSRPGKERARRRGTAASYPLGMAKEGGDGGEAPSSHPQNQGPEARCISCHAQMPFFFL